MRRFITAVERALTASAAPNTVPATYRHDPAGTGLPALAIRHQQACLVLEELDADRRQPDEARLYWVRFADGYEDAAFEHELTPNPSGAMATRRSSAVSRL